MVRIAFLSSPSLESVSAFGLSSHPFSFTHVWTDSSTPFSFMKDGLLPLGISNGTIPSFEPWKWITGTGRLGVLSSMATVPATGATAAMRSDSSAASR